jgi:hypothetical protein
LSARKAYWRSTTETEQRRAYAQLVAAQRKAYDAENIRRLNIGLVAGLWSLSFLDALVFPAKMEPQSASLQIRPVHGNDRAGLALAWRF